MVLKAKGSLDQFTLITAPLPFLVSGKPGEDFGGSRQILQVSAYSLPSLLERFSLGSERCSVTATGGARSRVGLSVE